MKAFSAALLSPLILLAHLGTVSAQSAETYKEAAAERAACTNDVYRLCKRYIPFRDRIVRCLERSQDLSPSCAAVIHGGEASAEARPSGRRDPRE